MDSAAIVLKQVEKFLINSLKIHKKNLDHFCRYHKASRKIGKYFFMKNLFHSK